MLGRGADAKMNLSTFETYLKLSVPSQQTMRLTSSVKIKTPGYDFQDTPAMTMKEVLIQYEFVECSAMH